MTYSTSEIFYTAEELQKPYAAPPGFQTGKVLGSAFAEGIQMGAQVRTKAGDLAWWTTSLAVQATLTGVFFGGSALVAQSLLSEHVLPKPTLQQIALVVQDRSFRDKVLHDWLPRTGYDLVVSFFTKNSSNRPTRVRIILHVFVIARNILMNNNVDNLDQVNNQVME